MSTLFVDTETTGYPLNKVNDDDPAQPSVTELAAVLDDDRGNTQWRFSALIKPDGWTVPDELYALTGISTELCDQHGVDIAVAMVLVGQALRSGVKRLVCHGVPFDLKMLMISASRIVAIEDIRPLLLALQTYCTLQNGRDVCKIQNINRRGFKVPKLAEAYQILCGKTLAGAHRAYADVTACREVYYEIIKRTAIQQGATHGTATG